MEAKEILAAPFVFVAIVFSGIGLFFLLISDYIAGDGS